MSCFVLFSPQVSSKREFVPLKGFDFYSYLSSFYISLISTLIAFFFF